MRLGIRLRLLIAAVTAGLLMGSPAISRGITPISTARAASTCAASTQVDIDLCMAKRAADADAALGRAYARLLASLDPKGKAKLRIVERAWVAYKTATCDYIGLSREGGSMQGSVISDCLAAMANEQAAKLSWWLKCGESAEVLPAPEETCPTF